MIERQFKEMFTGAGVLIVGFNLIGFGVVQNGGNYRGNPIWSFIQGFWWLQTAVLYALISAAVLFGIIKFVMAKDVSAQTEESKHVQPMMKVVVPELSGIEEKSAFIESPVIISKLEPPPKPPPTAAELKRRALRQITGKEF